jgi:opacity protein-like surface antigen
MKERVKALLFGAVALLAAIPASAQVGHDPAKSPYADLEYSQEFTLLGGYLRTRHDPAGILPTNRSLFGARYEITLTGPLALSADFLTGSGDRHVVDPLKPTATRNVGTQSNAVFEADIAAAMNLTGTRSWHNLVPQIRAGVGIARSRAADDSSGYSFGTPFAFTYGAGVKYVPGGRFQLRADVTDHVFKQNYPDAYYRIASDNTAVVPTTTARSFYTHHTALTIGVSYLFAR